MPIAFQCENCRKPYEVGNGLAGKRVKCKVCGSVLKVPDPDDSRRPAPRSQRSAPDPYGLDEDTTSAASPAATPLPRTSRARRKEGGVPNWLWGAVAGVGLLLAVVVFASLVRRTAPTQRAVQRDDENAPPAAVAKANVAEESTKPAIRPHARATAPEQSAWRVSVDPGPDSLTLPALPKLEIPIPEAFVTDDVLFPTTQSPFVILGDNQVESHYREVWDLRVPARTGRLAGAIETSKPMALSPDGEYFAAHTYTVPRTTDIWRISDGVRVARIPDGERIPDILDFAGPGRILVGTSYAKQFQVWEFATGRVVCKIVVGAPWGIDRGSVALSPGRRFMALAHAQGNLVQVFDLTTGQPVGKAPLEPGGDVTLQCQALAFSPDGRALAGLFEAGSTRTDLICWDVATGRREADFQTEGQNPYNHVFGYDSNALQWLSDQTGWLVYDQAIVERKTGQTVWSLPFDQRRGAIPGPRRLLDTGRLLTVMKAGDRKTLQLVVLSKEKIEAALGIAKRGGNAIDATLPPLTSPDRSSATVVTISSEPPPWTVAIDPRPAPRTKSAAAITLKVPPLDLIGLLVSAPSAQAIVTSSREGRLSTTGKKGNQGLAPRQVERYDIVSGRLLARFEMAPAALPMALSPDGTELLLGYPSSPDRLDLHKAADGQPLAGWRPYAQDSGNDRNVVWADFLSNERVLTVNTSGTLVLWSLPACKAEYVAPGAVQGTPLLSLGRKSLAAVQGGSLRIIDPNTGRIQGVGETNGQLAERGLAAAAFQPDGKELAAVLDTTIVFWNLSTGEIAGTAACPIPNAASLQYVGENHLLIDGKALFDTVEKRAVWYFIGGLHAATSPDSAHWLAAGPMTGPGILRRMELPDKTIIAAEKTAADPKAATMLRAGVAVGLEVTGNPLRDAASFRADVIKGLAGRVQDIGAEVADGQPIRIVATFQEKDTGRIVELRKLGPNFQNTPALTMAMRNVEWSLAVADNRGQPVVFARDAIGARFFGLIQLPPGETDVEGYLRQQQWKQAAAAAVARSLPYFIARRAGGAVILPGLTDLGYPRD